jgi:hypothetical protein
VFLLVNTETSPYHQVASFKKVAISGLRLKSELLALPQCSRHNVPILNHIPNVSIGRRDVIHVGIQDEMNRVRVHGNEIHECFWSVQYLTTIQTLRWKRGVVDELSLQGPKTQVGFSQAHTDFL